MRSGRRIDGAERDEPAANAHPTQKGRGTVWAIQHRFSGQLSEAYDDGWGTLDQQASEETLPPATQMRISANVTDDFGNVTGLSGRC